MSDEQPPPGLVAGKYKLTRLLGRGGMGSVWEGVHATLGNRVACKFIEPEHVDSVDAVTRFENEARAAASLKSKHVVDVYDHGVMPDGRPYIVMEFLEGEPLDKRIEKYGVLNTQLVATIVLQVSRALSRAHKVGIVHRDLKPENVFLVWDDEDQTDVAKVVDFGIAKFTDSLSSGISSATKTGSILGSPYYMSPEQARGLKNLDARSDNWSLAVIAYEALTGQRPFDGEAVGDLLVRICTTDPVPPSSLNPALPAAIDEWFLRALHRDPDKRFQDVREMAEQLLTIAGLPGRGTLGSAVGGPPSSIDRSMGLGRAAIATQNMSSVKTTSGALTHSALESPITELPVSKVNPLLIGAAAVALLTLVGGAFALGGGGSSEKETDDEPAIAASPAVDAADPALEPPKPEKEPEAKAAKPTVPEPKAEPEKPREEEVKAEPAPRAQPSVAPKPRAQTAQPSPAPKPAPASAPAPKPAPAKSGNFDLGY